MKRENLWNDLTRIINRWSKLDTRLSNMFMNLQMGETDCSEVQRAVRSQLDSVKHSELFEEALNDLYSLVQFCNSPSHNTSVFVADKMGLNEYFISMLTGPTGVTVKIGVRDFVTMKIIHSEMISPDYLFSGVLEQAGYLTERNTELTILLINSFYSSLLSIIDLCLQNSNQPFNIVKN